MSSIDADYLFDGPDIHSASEDYARRFSGNVGQWLLKLQEQKALGLLKNHSVRTILDVGGGHAQLAIPLMRSGYEVTVTGSSDVCALRLQEFIEDGSIQFSKCKLCELPFSDRSFDAVVCFRQLCHVDYPEVLLKEFSRVANRLIMIDYPCGRGFNALGGLFFPFKKYVEGNTRPYKVFSPKQIAGWYDDYGWEVSADQAQLCLPLVLHRKMRSLMLSQGLEGLTAWLGLTHKFGSPIICTAIRGKSSALN